MPDQQPVPSVTRVFWCERVIYRTVETDEIAKVSRHLALDPSEAIRFIRLNVRALVTGLPPRERHRALSWVDGGGCIGAIGALHRGEPCGFSLSWGDAWIEWTVRPQLAVHVDDAGDDAVLPTPCEGC
ncbi:hypothetical protein GCM10015535_45430 [Streptomyces gelaticus]|uniref:Uncharacterized protein n=1 Tax=Streptomyces gelaticus TaxID=285446 RepID=A0ABQ2W5X3_9ACTN|nr:hypothetical protein [Streptomyces gelaticus]GGV90125.1 hypothetical protein GCM10015535_45430 [Streptomyces gelaticus]